MEELKAEGAGEVEELKADGAGEVEELKADGAGEEEELKADGAERWRWRAGFPPAVRAEGGRGSPPTESRSLALPSHPIASFRSRSGGRRRTDGRRRRGL